MKTAKTLLTILIVSSILASCFNRSSDSEQDLGEYDFEDASTGSDIMKQDKIHNMNENGSRETIKKGIAQNQIKKFPIYDVNTGMISSIVPFPSSWNRLKGNNEYTFEGPNKLKVSGTFGKNFTYGNQYTADNVPPMNVHQIVEQFFMPVAKQTNRSLLNIYELPKVANTMKNYMSQLWEYAPSRKSFRAYGLEWQDDNNLKYITVLHVLVSESQYGNYWSFFGQYLQSSSEDFEQAKKAFVYGLQHTQYNPQYIAVHNQREIQKSNTRGAAHQARMATRYNSARTAKTMGDIYSEISDINHNGYMKRSGMNDVGHSKSVDGVYGTTTVFNPNASGQQYQVESYDTYYYGNNQGDVISTDNSLYNPNLDANVNNQNWERYEIDND